MPGSGSPALVGACAVTRTASDTTVPVKAPQHTADREIAPRHGVGCRRRSRTISSPRMKLWPAPHMRVHSNA